MEQGLETINRQFERVFQDNFDDDDGGRERRSSPPPAHELSQPD